MFINLNTHDLLYENKCKTESYKNQDTDLNSYGSVQYCAKVFGNPKKCLKLFIWAVRALLLRTKTQFCSRTYAN